MEDEMIEVISQLWLLMYWKPFRQTVVFWFCVFCIGFMIESCHAHAQYDSECRPLPLQGYVMAPQPPVESCLRAQAAQRAAQEQEREREEAAERQAAAVANARLRAEQQREAAINAARIAAENSPSNFCRNPAVAGIVMNAINSMMDENYPALNTLVKVRVVDLEHITTVEADYDRKILICHATIVTTINTRAAGVFTARKNAAGEDMVTWIPDHDD
jgi:hypothetical protein